jgi:hypothetical protein
MLSTKLLLQNKVNKLPKTKRRDFLINCIHNNEATKKFIQKPEKEILTKDIKIDYSTFCKICNKYDFIRDKYSETCQTCGYIRDIVPTQKTFEKIEYIKPGSNLVKIKKDSKNITVDLNKINLWLQNTDPLANDTKKIIDNLETIFQSKSIELPNIVQNTSVSLWYNFNSFYVEYTGSLSSLYNKKAILALCVYYGASIHGYTISLQQLSILFNVNVSDIINTNTLFKYLFKNTEYYENLNLQEKQKCNLKLSVKNQIIFDKIKNDLSKSYTSFSGELDNKEYAGIVYFITNKVNPIIKYTLKDLEEKCNISTTTISSISKSIERFYKNNVKLYKQLLI